MGVCVKNPNNAPAKRQNAAAPKEADQPELLRASSPAHPVLIKFRADDRREDHRRDVECDQRPVRTEPDPLQQSQQKYVRLEVDGRGAVARVWVAVGEVESLGEMLASVGDVIGQVILNEGRGNQSAPPCAKRGPRQRDEGG